jgi:phage shock protein C
MTEKRLYRSREHAMLGGVCAGIAEYFDTDPSLVRLATVIMFFAGGIGILAYIVAWIIIPNKPLKAETPEQDSKISVPENEEHSDLAHSVGRPRFILGIGLIALGALFLMSNILPWFSFFNLWPVILIIIGVLVISRGIEKGGDHEN